jgi:hypothetical protein
MLIEREKELYLILETEQEEQPLTIEEVKKS